MIIGLVLGLIVIRTGWAEDWRMYRHDTSGSSDAGEPLTAEQARDLAPAWTAADPLIANPVISDGQIFAVTVDGITVVLDAATGQERWRFSSAAKVQLTCGSLRPVSDSRGQIGAAAVVGDRVFIPGGDGAVHALDSATGVERWLTAVTNPSAAQEFLWSSAFPLDGKIFVGVGAVHESECGEAAGRLVSLDQATGQIVGIWWATDDHSSGGGLWTTPVYDPATRRMFVTTGNAVTVPRLLSRSRWLQIAAALIGAAAFSAGAWLAWARWRWPRPVRAAGLVVLALIGALLGAGGVHLLVLSHTYQPLAQAIVAIDPETMATLDSFQTPSQSLDTLEDLDYGASPTLVDLPGGRLLVVAINKNGHVYAFDRTHLAAGSIWQYQVSGSGASPDLGESTISSSAYSHGLVFVAGGMTPDGRPGKIAALDASTGAERWAIYPDGFVLPALTISGEVIFAGLSNVRTGQGALLVLRQTTGETVHIWPTPSVIWAEPTYANGTVYIGDTATGLWALTPRPANGLLPTARLAR